MKRKIFQKTALLLSVVLIICSLCFALSSCTLTQSNLSDSTSKSIDIREDGNYSSKEEVAGYIHKYGKLPGNFITKSEAKSLGWDSKKGNYGRLLRVKVSAATDIQTMRRLCRLKRE